MLIQTMTAWPCLLFQKMDELLGHVISPFNLLLLLEKGENLLVFCLQARWIFHEGIGKLTR